MGQRAAQGAEAWLGPVWSGLLQGIGAVTTLWVILGATAAFYSLPDPSAEVFHDTAQIGVGLLIAFSVAVAGVNARDGESPRSHLEWLCFDAGVGLTGLTAIAVSIALAAYREAGHTGVLDKVGLAFIASALFMLGLVVALQPYLSFYWKRSPGQAQ